MSVFDLSVTDALLSTTRSVRKRLDLERAVPEGIIRECLELALQAPTGSNRQGWRWIVVTEAAAEVGPALFFSLLIITLSFIPVFTLEAQEGRLFAPLAFTKTYAMGAAAILSVTLVPILMGWLIRGRIPAEQANPVNRWLTNIYRPAIDWTMKRPKAVLLIAALVFATTAWPLSRLGGHAMRATQSGIGYGQFGAPRRQGPSIASRKGAAAIVVLPLLPVQVRQALLPPGFIDPFSTVFRRFSAVFHSHFFNARRIRPPEFLNASRPSRF